MNALVLLLVVQTSVQAEIQKQYDAYARAYVKNDVRAMLATLTIDYELISGEGKVITLKQYRGILESRRAKGERADRYSVKILKIDVKGATANVSSEETSATKGGKSIHHYEDTWVKRGRVWLLRRSKSIHEG